MALDRTWYNTLTDDDGTNTTGTVWNKAAVNSLMEVVDVALATYLPLTGGTLSGTLTVGNWMKIFTTGVIRLSDGSGTGTVQAYDVAYRALALDGSSVSLKASGVQKLGVSAAGLLTLDAYTATTFAAGDKYLVIDASGNVHRSAIGPAS